MKRLSSIQLFSILNQMIHFMQWTPTENHPAISMHQ